MKKQGSAELYRRAVGLMPGGVNSPVRAFQSVNAAPFYVDHAKGPYLYDVDGNRYIDLVSSWGAVMLGHADEGLTGDVQAAVAQGTSFGACHPFEPLLAELIVEAFPSMEMVRLTNSGTEATMSAIRLARGATGRTEIGRAHV
jgi:glutamate-1-semialdehyde 2,1-aminomutase